MADRPDRRGLADLGFDEHLGAAARIAVEGMLDLMEREHGLERSVALAFASVVVDVRVTQVVNQVLGVHAVLRDDAIGERRLRLWLERGQDGFHLRERPRVSRSGGRTRASGSWRPRG